MTPTHDADAAALAVLMEAAGGGDAEALAVLLAPHRAAMHLHCYRLLGSVAAADDALDRTMMRIWRGLRGYRGQTSMRSWLLGFATTTCLRPAGPRAVPRPVEPYPEDLLSRLTPEDRAAAELPFVTALRRLPLRPRAVLVLSDVLNWPAQDVARTLGVPVTTIQASLERAREEFRRGT